MFLMSLYVSAVFIHIWSMSEFQFNLPAQRDTLGGACLPSAVGSESGVRLAMHRPSQFVGTSAIAIDIAS